MTINRFRIKIVLVVLACLLATVVLSELLIRTVQGMLPGHDKSVAAADRSCPLIEDEARFVGCNATL